MLLPLCADPVSARRIISLASVVVPVGKARGKIHEYTRINTNQCICFIRVDSCAFVDLFRAFPAGTRTNSRKMIRGEAWPGCQEPFPRKAVQGGEAARVLGVAGVQERDHGTGVAKNHSR